MAKQIELDKKLDLMLRNQKKILENERKILGEEEKIEELEEEELTFEQDEKKSNSSLLKELEELEEKVKKTGNPLSKITQKDMAKGFVGAFIGVVGHFAFSKASDVAIKLDFLHATFLYVTAFFMIIIMLYYTGFRTIEKHIILKVMPLRALILYGVSIFAIIVVFTLFGKITTSTSFIELYTLVGASIILGVLGAGMADLIGRNE